MIEFLTSPVVVVIFCALLGGAAHVTKKTVQYRVIHKQGSIVSYIRSYPYHLLHNTIITIGCCLALHEFEQLNAASAFFSGYMSNSVLSLLRAKTIHVDPNAQPDTRQNHTDLDALD